MSNLNKENNQNKINVSQNVKCKNKEIKQNSMNKIKQMNLSKKIIHNNIPAKNHQKNQFYQVTKKRNFKNKNIKIQKR